MTPADEQRMRFVFALRQRGVMDARVLEAMEKIDRGAFVKGIFADRAYEDMPLPIACGQTISQPSVVGLMTQALAGRTPPQGSGDRHRLGLSGGDPQPVGAARLHGRPPQAAGAPRRRRCSTALGLSNITALATDGTRGYPEQAPFDRIIVTAAAEDPPGPLLAELKPGGIMVVPVGQSDAVQSLVKVTRTETGFDYDELRQVRFVPLVEGMGQD